MLFHFFNFLLYFNNIVMIRKNIVFYVYICVHFNLISKGQNAVFYL